MTVDRRPDELCPLCRVGLDLHGSGPGSCETAEDRAGVLDRLTEGAEGW